jgi:hypothetical protein
MNGQTYLQHLQVQWANITRISKEIIRTSTGKVRTKLRLNPNQEQAILSEKFRAGLRKKTDTTEKESVYQESNQFKG